MATSNAEWQRAYRQRHIKDLGGERERLNLIVDHTAITALKRLAKLTQTEMLVRVLADAEARLLATMPGAKQDKYPDAFTR